MCVNYIINIIPTKIYLERPRYSSVTLAGKTLRKVPLINVPADVERQEVPLDPALAIANRFGKLATA